MSYFRKVIRIQATDSPNVRLALAQHAKGLPITGEVITPGVLTWDDYQHHLVMWDPIRQTIGLRAEFYKGKDKLMFPAEWRTEAETFHRRLVDTKAQRIARAMGVDSAEGGDSSSWAVVDRLGLMHLQSEKTPDTTDVVKITMGLMRRYNVAPEMIMFDRGGGGKQHADRMWGMGYKVRSVGFGEAPTPPPQRSMKTFDKRVSEAGDRQAFKNKRAEIYWMLRELIDPSREQGRFAIPAQPAIYAELQRQLSVIPLMYDDEGIIFLPPKRKGDQRKESGNVKSLEELLGRSPDEADALVLATYAMLHQQFRASAGMI